MNNMAGLSSYDKVESMQAYEMTDEELMGYCVLKMESAQSNAAFIEERIFTGGGYHAPLEICEIGGGNGKLLYCLEKKGLLKKGVNYEVSKSRCDLAERFAGLLSCSKVETRNRNFLEEEAKENAYDCIIMVDIVMQLITPLYDHAWQDMTDWLRKALKTGGYLFAEIVDYTGIMENIRREGDLRRWEEFPPPDPFQYSLQKLSEDADGNLVIEKHFIGRDNHERDNFQNVICPDSPQKLERLLSENGFQVSVFKCQAQDELAGDNVYRILAKKL